MRKLSRIVDNQFRVIVKDSGVSENLLTILFFLSQKGEVEQGVIGKIFCLERSTVSRNINALVKKELVTKSEDHHPIITITDKGNALVMELAPRWESIMDNLYLQLGNENIEALEKIEKALL